MGGYAFTYDNVMQPTDVSQPEDTYKRYLYQNPETIFYNLILALKQIDNLKDRVWELEATSPEGTTSTVPRGEGLTYTGAEFDAVVTACVNNSIDIRLHDADINVTSGVSRRIVDPTHQWMHPPEALTEGYRMFIKPAPPTGTPTTK